MNLLGIVDALQRFWVYSFIWFLGIPSLPYCSNLSFLCLKHLLLWPVRAITPSLSAFVRSVFGRPHVIWLDNYAHVLRVNMPTATKGWWNTALWSAKAAITLKSLDGKLQFLRTASRAMPTLNQLFSDAVTTRFRKYYEGQENKTTLCFDTSLSKNVRRIPITSETPEAVAADKDRKFIPLGIVGQNIGSNAGLIKILNVLRIEEEHNEYIPAILVDCNIYWRMMKVCLTSSLHQMLSVDTLICSSFQWFSFWQTFFPSVSSSFSRRKSVNSFGKTPSYSWGHGMSTRWRRLVCGACLLQTSLLLFFMRSFQAHLFLGLQDSCFPLASSASFVCPTPHFELSWMQLCERKRCRTSKGVICSICVPSVSGLFQRYGYISTYLVSNMLYLGVCLFVVCSTVA